MSAPEAFTEYGYVVEYTNGRRCAVSPLGNDEESAAATLRMYAVKLPERDGSRRVLVSRRVTRTAWADVEIKEITHG